MNERPRTRLEIKFWLRRIAHHQVERDTAAASLFHALKRADEVGATDEEIRDAQNGKPPPDESEPYRGGETTYCLRSDSTYEGKPLWFSQMTDIGPMTTADPAERAVFASRDEACASPAMRHMLSTFEPEPVSGGD